MKIKLVNEKNDNESIEQVISIDDGLILNNKEYTVYAFSIIDGDPSYCLLEDRFYSYPRWYSYHSFELIDQRISRFWIFTIRQYSQNGIEGSGYPFLSFPEWANDINFHNLLVYSENDHLKRSTEIFLYYKKLMDLEFKDKSVVKFAQIGDDKWLICPSCFEGWKNSDTINALVICPKCNFKYNNPRYEDILPSNN